MKKFIAAAILATFGANAQADVNSDAGGNSRNGSGDMILVAINENLDETLVWDLSSGVASLNGEADDFTVGAFTSGLVGSFSISNPVVTDWVLGAGNVTYALLGLSFDESADFFPGLSSAFNTGVVHSASAGDPTANTGNILQGTLLNLTGFYQDVCPSSNKWDRCLVLLRECFAHHFHVTRRVVDSANDVSR